MTKPWSNGRLCVMGNNQYFANGTKPFFLLGDTAWTLFQKLDNKESYIYLKNRKDKGYNTIAAVLINFQSKGKDSSFKDLGEEDVTAFLKPENEPFWKHVEEVISMAENLGLYIALLPVWGKVVKTGKLNKDNVEAYTQFLVNRFSHFPNIIWVLGGDIRGNEGFDIWNTMGHLLKEKTPNFLIGYHPFGRTSSSYWLQDCQWLDFHMFQSGHRRSDQKKLNAWDEAIENEPWFGEESFRYVLQDLNRTKKRPVLDGEPSYEQIPQGLHNPQEPYWQAHHARRYAYWSVLSGAAGHIYGHNAIIQFYGTGSAPVYGAKETWDISMHDIGSSHMEILSKLMEEIDFSSCRNQQQLLKQSDWKEQNDTNIAFGNENKMVVYSYSGKPFTMQLPSGMFDAYWIDPESGVKSYFGEMDGSSNFIFTPPNKKLIANDWLLYLKKR